MTGKCGEADNIPPESRVGKIITDGSGRRWIKVRHLGPAAWAAAFTDSQYDLRTGKPITDYHAQAMGYELAP